MLTPATKKNGKGKRLSQNMICVQQLKNTQYIITLPHMWADIMKLKKGSVVTFIPGKRGGIEIVKVKEIGK
jgi:hypothetical protein